MLTDAQIKKLATPGQDQLIPAGDRLGLYLRLRATGRRTWITRRRIGGAWQVQTLGDWPTLTALNARRMAATAEVVRVEVVTFAQAVETFYREQIEPRYRGDPLETKAYLVRDCTAIASRRVDRITRADLVGIIRRKTAKAPNAATKLLAIQKQFWRWALLGGLVQADPTAGLTARALMIPTAQPRERKLSDDELRELWALPDEPYGRLLRFALLTGCRIGEAIQIAPEQITGDVWTIPITKNGRPHSVPLSATAAALAAAGWPPRTYIALNCFIKARALGWRPHDLRRTAATRMRAAGVPSDAIEAVLNHTPPRLVRHYQQPDMLPAMREALLTLEAEVLALVRA